MDISKRLTSILGPHRVAARASHRNPAGISVKLPTQFARQLADATQTPSPLAPAAQPMTAATTEAAITAAESAPAPSIAPQPGSTASKVADVVAAALRAVAAPASTTASSNPGQVVAAAVRAVPTEVKPAASASKGAAKVASAAWPARVMSATGSKEVGVSHASDAGVHAANALKFQYYTDPAGSGVSDIGREGRMFLAAVDRGYVPKTVEGLETMLEWGSMGDFRAGGIPTGRPPEISAFFLGWSDQAGASNG